MRGRFAEALGLDPTGVASLLVSQPTALGLGFALSILVVLLRARQQSFRSHESAELLIAALVGALLLGRGLDMIWWGGIFLKQPWRIVDPWFGGVSTLGGLIGAVMAAVLWARRRGLDGLRFLDAASPAAGLTVAFFKLGCLLAGCCYGARTSAGLGVRFPPSSLVYYDQLRTRLIDHHYQASLPVHPVQAYEALAGALVFAVLIALSPWLLKRPGASLLLGGSLLLASRLGLEQLRASSGVALLGLSGAQWACVAGLLVLGSLALLARPRRVVLTWLRDTTVSARSTPGGR